MVQVEFMRDVVSTNVKSKKNLLEFKSIKTELTVIIITMLIIAGIVLIGIAATLSTTDLEESTINTIESVAINTALKIEIVNSAGMDLVALLALSPAFVEGMSLWDEGTSIEVERSMIQRHLEDIIKNTSYIFKE